jgi:hypothetical protein
MKMHDKAIVLARKNLGGEMESSARVRLTDAINCYDASEFSAANRCALDSLRYSVGVFHDDYKTVLRIVQNNMLADDMHDFLASNHSAPV